MKLMDKLVRPLVAQLMDLRSAVTKEASNSVRIMAQTLENDFKPLAAKLMHSSALFKLVSSATKVISEHGHVCCLAILHYCHEPKIIENIFENLTSKNNNLRSKCAMYINIILSSWPEYVLEKYLGASDAGGSFKTKTRAGGDSKVRGGRSKQRPVKENRLGGGTSETTQTFEEFFKICLSDATPDCRYFSRQAFLAFQEIWPEEAEPLIQEFKSVFMKDKEMVEKLGPLLEGGSTHPRSAKIESAKRGLVRKQRERQTEKHGVDSHGFLSPPGAGSRRMDTAPKSQNRMNGKNKFLSEEREPVDNQNLGSQNKQAALSTGFRNIRVNNFNQKDTAKGVYVSKYKNQSVEPSYK
jgi:hypothetical protein